MADPIKDAQKEMADRISRVVTEVVLQFHRSSKNLLSVPEKKAAILESIERLKDVMGKL